MMIYSPTFNRILIEEVEQQKSNSLIYVPPTNDSYIVAKILRVGPTAGWRDNHKLQPYREGDLVVLDKKNIVEIKINNETFKTISDDLILALVYLKESSKPIAHHPV